MSLFRIALCLSVPIGGKAEIPALQAQTPSKRLVTIGDVIQMTQIAESESKNFARFSPDGKQFVFTLKKGNLQRNTNEFVLLLYQTADAFRAPQPEILLKMSSSSNRDVISRVCWLADNRTLSFLAENEGQISQVYSFNIQTRKLQRLTSHPTAITNYAITQDGRQLLFMAEPTSKKSSDDEQARREGVVITDQPLPELLSRGSVTHPFFGGRELFLQVRGQSAVSIPIEDLLQDQNPLSFSPDGRYALIGSRVLARNIPTIWEAYDYGKYDEYIHRFFKTKTRSGISPLTRYLLLDTKKKSTTVLWNAPMRIFNDFTWSEGGQSVFLSGYLPLDGVDPDERDVRKKTQLAVEITLASREVRKVTKDEFPATVNNTGPLDVILDEDLNTSPKIYVSGKKEKEKALLLDLNPQFGELDFGKVEIIEWQTADGIEVKGGLYLPSNYERGKRYPLVIQTHGFVPNQFSMDGRSEWSSGYSARLLAANGIVVLQAYAWKSEKDEERIYSVENKKWGDTKAQAVKKVAVAEYEAAIDLLDQHGLIDRRRVGIMGFSRTVCFVAYALTHSKHPIAAALLVDGIDCGYFQYMVFGADSDLDDLNGGAAPFGANLTAWIGESPSFNLDRVRTPIRLEAHGGDGGAGVLEHWEWFSGLSSLAKPVEYIYLPDAPHLLVKPWERAASQKGAVDWFRFWLKDEEDTNPSKNSQYARWRELRKLVNEKN
jgi:dipeptidyl aminopeptidase/acylaminoacyl peptidase